MSPQLEGSPRFQLAFVPEGWTRTAESHHQEEKLEARAPGDTSLPGHGLPEKSRTQDKRATDRHHVSNISLASQTRHINVRSQMYAAGLGRAAHYFHARWLDLTYVSGLGINHEYHRVDVILGKVTRWPPYKLPGAISYKYGDPGSLKGFVHSVGKNTQQRE